MNTIEKPITKEPWVLPRDSGVYDIWFPSNPHEPGRYRAKVTGSQTNGRLAQVHLLESQGAAPPVHLHRHQDETIYVIDGQVSVFLSDDRIEAGPGAFLFVPRGSLHTWLVRSDRAEMLLTLAPAGLERFFAEVGLAAVPGEPRPPQMAVDVEMNRRAEAYGVEFFGPPPTLD